MSLVITDAGIAASIHAEELGVEYKITHIAIGLEGYLPTVDQTQLKQEAVRKPLSRGSVPAPSQLHFEAVFDDDSAFEGKEIGYFLEDGTLFAVDSRGGEIMSLKRSNTIITEAFELNLAGSEITNITVEIMGTPYASETVAGIAKIATNEQVDEGIDDSSFLTIKKFTRALSASYVINKLVENLWLGIAKRICPVGVPLPWGSDIAPEGFAIHKGQAFDVVANPELAKLYPDGIIPDMRGLGIIGKEDGELVLAYEEGQVKQHGHPNSTVSSTNLGTKSSNTTGNHAHGAPGVGFLVNQGGTRTWGPPGGSAIGYQDSTEYAGNHAHTVAIGSHAHSVVIALFGALKNTINHRKFNWIVRLA
ncbi:MULTISPECIES: phage tail-collar fiber domain-containing protein [Vibrio]|uniref:phage tail-collar fiber domain-containing protein n=1 Tax=Vibrio TaxID=662 RepID=UPI000B5C2324|nr:MULTISPECIES: phage tail protein [Vibrio]HBV77646.1 phage tail protein [Vibrio sp.]